jgi:hypothetical protein
MAKKTAILVSLKYEQKSTELAKAIAVEERAEQGIEIPLEEAQVLDVEAKSEGKPSALDALAAKSSTSSNAPECAGCGKNVPAPTKADAEGRAFHAECLDVLKKAGA